MNKRITLAATVCVAVLAFAGARYWMTHKPLERIPSDSAFTDHLTIFTLGDQGTGDEAQKKVAQAMEKLAEHEKIWISSSWSATTSTPSTSTR
jgi:hypothetical protein